MSELKLSALMLAMAPGNGGGLLGNPWLEGALTRSPLVSSSSENGSEPLAPCFSALFRFISLNSCFRSLRLRFLCSFPPSEAFSPSSSGRTISFSFISVEIFTDSPFLQSGMVFASTTSLSVSCHDIRVSMQGLAVWIRAEYIPYLAIKECCSATVSFTAFRLRSFAM